MDMEQCEPLSGREHPWKAATMKRRAWAQSRDSWQAPESQDDGAEEPVPAKSMEEKPSAAEEPGRLPNKIASWLQDCRTPLGASLDEQSGTPTKGVSKNGCSFEDDLSLGAEANHLQPNGTKAEVPCYGVPAEEKRTQFKQKGRSMNSTGSGKSNTTVSSVSELLDLYEEDPEEILYNLGFGREEPNMSSKVPSRFFNGSSSARGIDIKVYLSAQLQRMELENPNYALTSRFRQIEVLTTVANAFSSLYSQVSGLPVQKIGNTVEPEAEAKEPPPLNRTNSTLNAVKMLKRSLTRHSLLTSSAEGSEGVAAVTNSDPSSPGLGGTAAEEHTSPTEVKPPKAYRKKDSPSLATVAEEALHGSTESSSNGEAPDPAVATSPHVGSVDGGLVLGVETPVLVSISVASEESDGGLAGSEVEELGSKRDLQRTITSTPDKEPSNLLPNPLLDHLRTSPQARESFEMDELQEDEPGTRSTSRAGSELLRTASQQSDSSGFAEDPSTDCSANYLKVQDSSDSCDSETTVTSHAGDPTTPLAADTAPLELDAQAVLETHSEVEEEGEEVPEYNVHQISSLTDTKVLQPVSSADQPGLTTANQSTTEALPQAEAGVSLELSSSMEAPSTKELGSPAEPGSTAEQEVTADRVCESALGSTNDSDSGPEAHSTPGQPASSPSDPPEASTAASDSAGEVMGASERGASDQVHLALHRAQERSSSVCEDSAGRAPTRAQELRKARLGRNPMLRSSSLPCSMLTPSRVVSSLRIQLGHGSIRQHTPTSFAYHYTPDPEGALEEGHNEEDEEEVEDEEGQPSCRTTLIINSPAGDRSSGSAAKDGPFSRIPPYPLTPPRHLALSNTSLYSAPHDWPHRPLSEAGGWSSVPNLTLNQPHPHSPTHHHALPHHQLLQFHSPYPTGPVGSPYNSLHSSVSGAFPQPMGSSFTPSTTPFFTPPQSAFFTPPQSASMLNSAPYGQGHGISPYSSPYHPQYPQQQQPDSRYSSPVPPYSPLVHPHSAPYSLPSSMPTPSRLGQPYNTQYSGPPCFPFPQEPAPLPAPSTTEMQLRRVLHEIRGTVHSLAQGSSPRPEDPLTNAFSPHRSVQTLYEDLQLRKRSLSVFRTQMMDLELALMRQQSQVYQHLSQEERLEAGQLQGLRGAVRQELQDLELQVEDRLLTLNEQLRAAQHPGLYRHPMAMHRGQSLDSLSNSSALEPLSDLLREQLYLQSELGYEGGLSCATTPMSGRSSGTASPSRSSRASGPSSPQRGGLYRATVCLTPAPPPRPGVEASQPLAPEREDGPSVTMEGDEGDGMERCSITGMQGSQAAIKPHLLEERGWEGGAAGGRGGRVGSERGAENPHMQQLIKEIKDSIADEIRQEILSELLAAVSPRRAVVVSREQP
ncbi:protein ITPRID2 isoform X2 [Clupea harengus]|uniref:Protein ITPRID2 isoform X2 n=1 Tax=Clupea harengus TaxID=7950 RepID=A0A6P3W4W5_CLUHA|nr:protein ITPRID2 isoform X2 [Clupea harengus]